MNFKAIIAIVLAIVIALGLTFVVDKYIFAKQAEFDVVQTMTNIIIVLVVVGLGAWVANKVTHTEGLQVKAKI